ncbi:hypothetical protein [Streptomyces sp. H39-S7]|uniref:hypothetical protein n=1 Tax=Streptomyces sp. H39-S7 TaxID=3004357 RepID=UPI0022B06A4A|nr:hypothetical protein [Streptomyces sp. H39-S7]MCZ4119752.1 hypothetical protein [Streptomyces sp. H39-S7]
MTADRRRLRSGTVVLGSMGLLAVSLVSCSSSSDPDKRCVNPTTYRTLDDKDCRDGGSGRYYYGGSVHNGTVSGGGFDKSSVKRGGIGHGGSDSGGG